ncbi:hypothetical protein AHF37_06568, partial [Paragonimus kellicotti]
LTLSQEEALRNAALDIIIDLPHYELKSKVECTNIELACWEQAKQLASQTHLDETTDNTALHSNITMLISDENRLNAVRDAAAVYGRAPGGMPFPPTSSGLPRSPSVGALIPYEIACNEAAAYLASAIPQLLTHRRELSELAKKVVRNSGCAFTNSSNMDKLIPKLFGNQTLDCEVNFQTLALSCEECNNIIDDVAIYTATGTDSLKKVRILNLSDCAFTGMVPMHLNQCSNLIELNLSGNALYAFPRCLHLPKLKRLNLRNNIRLLRPTLPTSVIEPPLVEQFPRLVSLELDPPLVKLLSRQSLACLCPYLKTINGEEFVEEPSEDTIKSIQAAKHQLSTLIYSKWEDDISGFYKKGLPKRDTIRVIETLVLHAVKRSVDIKEPFSHCASVLARRVAEDFLSPKMLDDECEDETTEKMQHTGDLSDDDEVADSDTEDGDEAESVRTDGADDLGVPAGETTAPEKVSVTTLKNKLNPRRKMKKLVSTEAAQAASVAEREALAAAANLALLPDEPPDRLINVVGQALRHGKTVVYAVIRTAARQPNGELIPVGGGLGITSSNVSVDTGAPGGAIHPVTSRSNAEAIANTLQAHYEAEAEAAETSKLIENITIPPPHAPPPPTMRMSTRDSNRLKRFSAYGVIDTAAALAGKEEALLAAALAQEDEKETDAARQIIEQSVTASPEEDPEVIAALSKAREDAMVVVLEADTSGWTVSNEVKVLQEAGEQETIESSKKRKRRGTDSLPTPSREKTSDTDSVPQSPASITGRKRVSKAQSPRPVESKRASVNPTESTPIACRQNGETAKRVHSLTQLGTVVDYDPLHFIRCHARDNDPLDCETKVWRCSFEPSVDSVCSETSNVVATCGGECVCLIDCRSGRVMKRFKHLGELPTKPNKSSVIASKRSAKPLLAQQHPKPATAAAVSRRQTQQSRAPAAQPTVSTTPVRQPTGAISLYSRRPGLLSRTPVTPTTATTAPPTQKITRAPPVVSTVAQLSPALTGPVYTLQQRRLLPSDYIIKPSQSESQPAYVVPNILVQSKPANWTPGRRGRPPVAHSIAKKAAAAEAEAAETSKLIENITIPPPHAPPPPTMRMSTRDSNRLKRFSAYGVIDTAAALAGKEEALLAAALAQEDEKETDAARQIIEQSVTASPEEDPEVIAALSKAREDAMVVVLEADTSGWTVSNEVKVLQEAGEQETIESSKKRKRRGTDSLPTPSREKTSDTDSVPQSPASITGRKRVSKAQSPRPVESKRASVNPTESTPIACRQNGETAKRVHSLTQLGTVVDYDPLHFIRCHARDNDPLDCETKVWRCSFEPSVDSVCSETSNVVATCGGECVCLIDCRSGRVMKRFKTFGRVSSCESFTVLLFVYSCLLYQEFYSLAWTTVEMAAGHKTNLLAAAGKLREIRLLHPEQLVCYAEMRGHKDDIACMIFNPDKPTILFSGDSKAVVLVWDIGIPSAPEYRTRHQLLMRLVCFRPNLNPVLNLIFLPKYDVLIAGCEDGLTDDLVVVKCVEEGEIYVFDYGQAIQRSKRLLGSKKLVNVEIRGQLRWQTTEEIYINVTARSGLNAVVCGDNEGTIWLYDLQKQVEEDARRFKLKPVKILEWPECSIGGAKEEDTQMKESITSGFKNPVVNATDISHDGQYLAAVTDNNLVCIWKFSG